MDPGSEIFLLWSGSWIRIRKHADLRSDPSDLWDPPDPVGSRISGIRGSWDPTITDFWLPIFFIPRRVDLTQWSPKGSQFDLFLFYPPEGVPNAVVLLWGPIWVSFSFISSPQLIFLISNSIWRIGLFFARDFLYWRMDGMGRTDGRSTFFFLLISWKLLDNYS